MESGYIVGNGGPKEKAPIVCPAAINLLEVGVVCCLLDENLSFLWGNDSFFQSIHDCEEDYRRSVSSLRQQYTEYPQDFASIQHSLLQTQKTDNDRFRLTVRLPSRGGGFSWMRLAGKILKDTESGISVLQAEFADVSELIAETEEQARRHQQKLEYFQWMMDLFVGNVYISDMDTYELLYLNQGSCQTLGTPADTVLGKKCYEVIQGRTTPCPFCTNGKLRKDEFYAWEFFNPKLDRTFMIKNRVINWEGHRARIELSHDMYSAEYKLAKKDRERDALLRCIPGGFARLDARDLNTVLWYGADYLNVIGYTAEQFESELHHQCAGYVHPEDLERLLPLLETMKTTGGSIVTEPRILTRSGETRFLTMSLTYANGEDSWDGIPSFYSVGIDVTKERLEQVRQRRALEDAYEAARVADDAKTNFLSSMSHDIRTPMNAIMGMSAIAQANLDTPDKIKDCLSKINASSRHLLGLINEVLDMSKIESGKIDLVPEVCTLPELFQDVMDMCLPLGDAKHHKFQMNADHVRHERVITDKGRLQQVLMNLLSNAVKYTPEGGIITMRVQELPSVAQGKGQFQITVTDTGIGMSKEFLPYLFEPFTRAEDSRISKTQGTGLGMAITENIVRMMNGTITVNSSPGKGSQFIVTLPLELCEEDEEYDAQLAGHSVLVVDNDQFVCESINELLKELGMRVEWVLSGKEAVTRLEKAREGGHQFFFVMLDWKMPEMDGLETIKMIREKIGGELPIILISAYDYTDVEEDFRRAGADAFITKPLFKSKLAYTFHQVGRFAEKEVVDTSEQQCSSLAGKRILLVEDNELNREIATELLHMQEILVDVAENGRFAVEKFQASPSGMYDCILMDIQMPVMDGYEATRVIRGLKRKDAQTVPILALTANAFASDLGDSHSAGMNDHIAKPIDMGHLLKVLRRWICEPGEKENYGDADGK